ncbi:L,D-transpeptidase family protein [Xanthobacter sp. DSM 24535]|uniref:L,D-transpeptidase n=1 Tax=Roseixanthobacter psychrophilus TaxID=3119917 RepID=UPI00372AE56C
MTLRNTLLSALGISVLAASAHAQTMPGRYYVPAAADADETTGAIAPPEPAGSLPGYNDPYARPTVRSDAVQSAPIAAPPGSVQAPTYSAPGYAQPAPQQGYSQGAPVQAAAPSNQPLPIAPQGSYAPQQGGYVTQGAAAPAASASQGYVQPGQGYVQPAQAAGEPPTSAQQDALRAQALQQGYVQPDAGYVQPQQGYVQPAPQAASYGGPAVGAPTAPPSGVYGSNAAVVPGTQEAPSGPRIEDVDPSEPVPERFRRQTVDFPSTQPAGTIVIDTSNTYLYLVQGGGKAIRYGIGVGRDGFTWAGTEKITRKAEWADWRPPAEMITRQPYLPRFMAGGPGNPLGARTLYLGGTVYRIHGTNEPQTIGKFVSSGCFRMLNADVEDLFDRVKVGTKVVIMPKTGGAQASAGSNNQSH